MNVTKDMLDLAKHIVKSKAGDFESDKFEDHYEAALADLINAKRLGKNISAKPRPKGQNVVDLMDALKKSLASETATPVKSKKPRKATAGQKEMLLPIEGKTPAAKKAVEPERSTGRRKAGELSHIACHLDAALFRAQIPAMSEKEALAAFKKALALVKARGVASQNRDGVAMLILETDRLKITFTPAKDERPNGLDIWQHDDGDAKVLDVIWRDFEMPMIVTYRGGRWAKLLVLMGE